MAKFLNTKEQVLDIQLTQYGKHLLSEGMFKPEYYAFFDDDILYDSNYANFNEVQNDTEDRIKETSRIETQYVFAGIETNISRINKLIRSGKETLGSENVQPEADKFYSLSDPLGNSSLSKAEAPSYTISFLNGELEESIAYKKDIMHPTVLVPQISSSIVYVTSIGQTFGDNQNDESSDENPLAMDDEEVKIFNDGTYIRVKDNFLLLEILEENTDFLRDNFDIQVFKIEELDKNIKSAKSATVATGSKETLTPLSFTKRDENNLVPELDATYVDYYFDVLVDQEIDESVFCKLNYSDKKKNILTDQNIKCSAKGSKRGNMYKIPVDISTDEECE